MNRQPHSGRQSSARATPGLAGALAYLAVWLLAGAATAAAILLLLATDSDRGRDRGHAGTPRPVRSIVLGEAMRRGRCRLHATSAARAGPSGARSVRAGIYRAPLGDEAYHAALALGIVVLEYGDEVARVRVGELAALQLAIPNGTIVAPARTLKGVALRAATYRRVLSCEDANPSAIDALQLFSGRFVGIGARAAMARSR